MKRLELLIVFRFDDCFKFGKCIDEGFYLLFDFEIFSKFVEVSFIIFMNENFEGVISLNLVVLLFFFSLDFV